MKGHEVTLGGDRDVQYHRLGGFMCTYMLRLTKCVAYCMLITPQ